MNAFSVRFIDMQRKILQCERCRYQTRTIFRLISTHGRLTQSLHSMDDKWLCAHRIVFLPLGGSSFDICLILLWSLSLNECGEWLSKRRGGNRRNDRNQKLKSFPFLDCTRVRVYVRASDSLGSRLLPHDLNLRITNKNRKWTKCPVE